MAADILLPDPMPATSIPALTPAGQAALDAAQVMARKATAPATLRAYKADWTHFSQWCAAHGFVAVPAAPATVGAYLASLAASHAPTTIRRRLGALGENAPIQRPGVEPGASRHPGTAAGRTAHPWPPGAKGHGADPGDAAPDSSHLRSERAAGATVRCCYSASSATLRTGGTTSGRRRHRRRRAQAAHHAGQDRPGRAGGGGRPAARTLR